MRVGHVFESRFSAGKISSISTIFGILNKEWLNFKKMSLIFLHVEKRLIYRPLLKTSFLQKNVNNSEIPRQILP